MRSYAVLTGLLAWAGPLVAAPLEFSSGPGQVTLLELYTSQGCSSCPPAERYINRLTTHDKLWTALVPLAFHVDYWDYIGWKDPYADPEHGRRQRDLAAAGNARTVYTPGFFNNGREWRGWVLRREPGVAGRRPGNLSVAVDGDRLTAHFDGDEEETELHVAVLGFDINTDVNRGENRGRRLAQEFVVLDYARYAARNGRWQAQLPVQASHDGRRGIAAWVTRAGHPEPLQATGGWLQ